MAKELEDLGRKARGRLRLNLALSKTNADKQYEDPEKPLIITHIPRTGGTTLDSIMRAVAGPRVGQYARAMGTIYDQYLGSEKSDAVEFILKRKRKILKVKHLIGHIPFGIHERLGFDAANYGVVVREPTIRALSQMKMSLPDVSEIGPNELRKVVRGNELIDNIQVRMIAGCYDSEEPCDESMFNRAVSNLENYYAYVGIQENFGQFLHLVMESENWPSILYTTKHVSKYTRVNFARESAEILDPYIYLDKLLYALVKEKFNLLDQVKGKPALLNLETVQDESQTDIVFYVHPYKLMGMQAGTIPHRLIPGALSRLVKNGLAIDLIR
ncbi:MAG: hypothetical protein ACJZ9F_03365 [Rhodospirillaceae bacterium]